MVHDSAKKHIARIEGTFEGRLPVDDNYHLAVKDLVQYTKDLYRIKIRYQERLGKEIIKGLHWLQSSIGHWQNETFGDSSKRPVAILTHLKREIIELENDIKENKDKKETGTELADCVILLVGLAEAFKIDLAKEIDEKMKVNRERKWKKPDQQGVIEHEQ